MMQLEKSQKFKKELHSYKTAMTEIDNTRVQQDLRILIERLVNEVKTIDRQHTELHLTKAIPEAVNSSRSNIVKIRNISAIYRYGNFPI